MLDSLMEILFFSCFSFLIIFVPCNVAYTKGKLEFLKDCGCFFTKKEWQDFKSTFYPRLKFLEILQEKTINTNEYKEALKEFNEVMKGKNI